MNSGLRYAFIALCLGGAILAAHQAGAGVLVQCPGDMNGSASWEGAEVQPPNTKCMHLSGGDGFITMADGTVQYIFGFSDLTGIPAIGPMGEDLASEVLEVRIGGHFPAPPIVLDEGDEFYLTLTNVGMMMRPDLFDPHTVHYHGFPEAASIFDGLPESANCHHYGIKSHLLLQGQRSRALSCITATSRRPNTCRWACSAISMCGPSQDGTIYNYGGRNYTKFAYNDGDGSTGYDVDYPIQIGSFDSAFHNASSGVQPLPFALMEDNYPMLNGRGYPDTVTPTAPAGTGRERGQGLPVRECR